ncbi:MULTISPECIES: TetR/AcrR family transcriptional regulator [Actinomycetes]|uniref:TetR/AcrR family transcriptional regulator n=1 Tax=Actinomycetes TaxID=1760 RepID=UPI0005250C67|nr:MULTISPECIES: TetR/AcrR family transcriptional regulator [Actinomycetes]
MGKEVASDRISRQKEAGAVTRAQSRRRLLGAATEVFAENGYAAATVVKIAERAGVSVPTLYASWRSKRELLKAMMESMVIGPGSGGFGVHTEQTPLALLNDLPPAQLEPAEFLSHLAHQFRLLAERAAVGWLTYAQAAAIDPAAAADWQHLMEVRRVDFQRMIGRIPPDRLHPGLTPAAAADTAWVIASPQSHDLLVRRAHFSYDHFEQWVRTTLIAALLPPST